MRDQRTFWTSTTWNCEGSLGAVTLLEPKDVYIVGYKYVDGAGRLQMRTLTGAGLPVNPTN